MWHRHDLARFVARAGSIAVRRAASRGCDPPAWSTRARHAAWSSRDAFSLVRGIRPASFRGFRGFATQDGGTDDPFASAEKAIITAYGPDRPGLVSSLAKTVLDAGGNVENTRMARLGDDCNVMMLVSFADSSPVERRAFARVAEEIPGLTVKVRPTASGVKRDARGEELMPDTSRWRRVFLHGTDFKGSLHAVTSYLGAERINIETLNTDSQRAPFGDDDLFTMEAVIEIGPDVSLAKFKKTMDRLKRKLGVDIVISEHESHRED